MRFLISILITGLLAGCILAASGSDYSDVKTYRPKPRVELSAFTAKDRFMAAYVKHSSGGVLMEITPGRSNYGIPKRDIAFVVSLDSPSHIVFNSGSYENFDRSRDVFQDGRVIVVPLRENDRKAVGVFVNLISGKRYFFAPTVTSNQALAQVRTVARTLDITVVVPEDKGAHRRLAQFPEFLR
jgi:hypothetical protein